MGIGEDVGLNSGENVGSSGRLTGLTGELAAQRIFVDQTVVAGNTYDEAARLATGGLDISYTTIQSAITACTIGDTIYMRDGTYAEQNVFLDRTKNGTSWAIGEFTSLMSYPGEWAVVDATGIDELNGGGIWGGMAVLYGTTDIFDTGTTNYNEYWFLRNFEVTGGGSGIAWKMKNCKTRFLYIHDNGRYLDGSGGTVSQLQSGMLSGIPNNSEIKYCWFKDNIETIEANANNCNILFDGDYRDLAGDGVAWIEAASTHSNEIAYNFLELTGANIGSSHSGIKHKNQQRFGLNSRNPTFVSANYPEHGDKIHHNIILGSLISISSGQDNVQVHNNILDQVIDIGQEGDIPQMYNQCVYNNTSRMRIGLQGRTGNAIRTASGRTEFGNTTVLNYYDVLLQQTIHEHIWVYSNIADSNFGADRSYPFRMHHDMLANTTNPDQDNSDMVVERNFIHDNDVSTGSDISVGHNFTTPYSDGCGEQQKTIVEFNACSESATWRNLSPGTILNWENVTPNLYVDTVGADQYKTVGNFVIDGAYTVTNGAVDVTVSNAHPYIIGGILPSYVGATNPADDAWVDGVYTDVRNINWLKLQTTDPVWLEQ